MSRMGIEAAGLALTAAFFLAGCGAHDDQNAAGPPPLKVEDVGDPNVFQAARPNQFVLTTAVEHITTSQLRATATVNPDISKSVPVISLATGRVIEVTARLGDTVKKGSAATGAKRGHCGRILRLPKSGGGRAARSHAARASAAPL